MVDRKELVCAGRALRRMVLVGLALVLGPSFSACGQALSPNPTEPPRPNILFCIADDWSWPHAGAYGDPVARTPAFDRIAREGVLFQNAFVASPSCTPSRAAILTGQWHWRLDAAANLWSIFPDRFATYPEMLKEAGYAVGFEGKDFGPGQTESAGRLPCGQSYADFAEFLERRPADRPFCFWLGALDPHRPYERKIGLNSGIDLDAIPLPAGYPDSAPIRKDLANYYAEVQSFDAQVGAAVRALEERGLLDATLVVVASDNGMPFPRGKSNLYDMGVHTPLAIRWPERVPGRRSVDDFVSLIDLAPTFLALAGVPIPEDMNGRSLRPILESDRSGQVDERRDHVLTGKERHVPAQEAPDMGGYPMRSIRTRDCLYIRNFTPERWPNGTPNYERAAVRGNWYADIDNSPTKMYIVGFGELDEVHRRARELCFEKRPAEELYDLVQDPDQVHNVASDPAYAETLAVLSARMSAELKATGDPRILGDGARFDAYPYLGSGPKHPNFAADQDEDEDGK